MKQYQDYMDTVEVSDTLHQKLSKLETQKKKPAVWKRYGAAAAALVLVLGLGGWGLSRMENNELGGEVPAVAPELAVSEPAIAPGTALPVPMPNSPGMETMGGYEVRYGEGENSIVAYYMLPLIHYGEVDEFSSVDMAPPVGVSRRDLTPEEIEVLFSGEASLITHLNWNDYTLYAHAMVNRDGSLWLLCVTGIKSETERFTLEVMPGALPPSCLVYGEAVTNNIWEREVTAVSHEGTHGSTRLVSFMDRDYGYRFEITNGDAELVSRLVRWVIAGDGLTFEKEKSAVNSEEMNTLPYDPNAAVSQGPVGPVPTPAPTVEPVPEP